MIGMFFAIGLRTCLAMVKAPLNLSDLIGRTIDRIGTVRDDGDGDDMIWFYLSGGLTIGCDLHRLGLESDQPYSNVWVDFIDYLERDSPEEEDDWRLLEGQFLLLADLLGRRIQALSTRKDADGRWVFLQLDLGVLLKVNYYQLVADGGPYQAVWPDFKEHLEAADAAHPEFTCLARSAGTVGLSALYNLET